MDETFEKWWAETWNSPEAAPAVQAAFKEIAWKAWEAGDENGYERAVFDHGRN